MDLKALNQLIDDNGVKAIDLKYTGLDGKWYHITFPARRLEFVLSHGVPFDGSSIPGMRAVESGDMALMPDIETAALDRFADSPRLRMICSICDAETRIGVAKDPRSVALRAQQHLLKTGIADAALWTPEFEFHLLDEATFFCDDFQGSYSLSSRECKHSLVHDGEDPLALAQQEVRGYHMPTPFDQFFEIRQQMVDAIEEDGIKVRYHHHEVGLTSQQEIETELLPFPRICDDAMAIKEIIRQTALRNNVTATFMPKPIYNHAGNGMHFHIMLRKEGRNVFYKPGGYADLSDEALWFIGGILSHGKSLVAFTNPSTNSFKRLLPGFEAPVKLFFGLANRSAAIRIPKYGTDAETKRFEFRTGDATCNPYLAMSALLMAGIDGVINRIDPTARGFGPYDDNVFEWPEEKKATLESIPSDLEGAMAALEADHEYLLAGGVFNKDLIESYSLLKLREHQAVSHRPHPYEMMLYYNS